MVPTLTASELDIQTAPPRAYFRPDVNLLDLAVRKEFRFGDIRRVQVHSDMFNLNNSSAIQGRTTQLGST